MSINRFQEEISFHDKRFSKDDNLVKKTGKYYSVAISATKKFKELVYQVCNGGNLLEYGCGTGSNSQEWIKHGANLTGIDISHEGIQKAKAKLHNCGEKAHFYVMNAEKTNFDSEYVDVIVGSAILHHLDLNRTYAELSRILNSDGRAVFLEPLGKNPIINLYRKFTPSLRTKNEHPLIEKDIKMAKKYFKKVEEYYYNLFTLFSIPFRNTIFFNPMFNFFQLIDRLLFKIPFIRKYAWIVILCLSEPIK